MNNFFLRIYSSFYSTDFYREVASQQKGSGFKFLVIIIALTYLVPALLISNKLSKFSFAETSKEEFRELQQILNSVPNLSVADGQLVLQTEANYPLQFKHSALLKNLIVIDPEQNSLIAANTLILFGKDGVYFNNLEVTALLFDFLGFKMFPQNAFSAEASFNPYKGEDYDFSGVELAGWLEAYLNGLGKNLLFTIFPLVVLASVFLKFVELYIFTTITRLVARNKRLALSREQAIKITAAAFIPALVIKFIDACSLWSSNLLKIPFMSLILLLGINYYFINFALDSLKKRATDA